MNNHVAHVVYFPSLRDCFPLLPDTLCFKKHSYILSSCLVVSVGTTYLVPVTTSRLGT